MHNSDINPILLARLHALRVFFLSQLKQVPLYQYIPKDSTT